MLAAIAIPLGALIWAADDAPVVKLLNISENRSKTLEKDGFFGGGSGLIIHARLEGADAKAALKSGNLRVSEAKDDTGADLISGEEAFGFNRTNQPDYKPITDFERGRDGKLGFDVRLKAPARAAKTISFKGEIDLLVGGEKVNADFTKINFWDENELKHAALDAAKLKVKTVKSFGSKPGRTISIIYEGDRSAFHEIQFVTAAGKVLTAGAPGYYQNNNGPKVYQFYFNEQPPADGTLRVVLLKNAKVVTAAFGADKLELP